MRLLASALMIALAVTAAAADAPKKREQIKTQELRGRVKISARSADLDRREYALYRGNVRLTSADLELSGDRLELRQPQKGQFTARVTGGPARLHHAAVADAPAITASAQQIDYDTRSAIVDLSGNAEVERGDDHITSDTIRYNVAARRISATGKDGGQVQIVVQPEGKPGVKP
jgi:lipopolysaccharide export system protein LptA